MPRRRADRRRNIERRQPSRTLVLDIIISERINNRRSTRKNYIFSVAIKEGEALRGCASQLLHPEQLNSMETRVEIFFRGRVPTEFTRVATIPCDVRFIIPTDFENRILESTPLMDSHRAASRYVDRLIAANWKTEREIQRIWHFSR